MVERFSLHGLVAGLLPSVYSARYQENLAESLNSQFLLGEIKARTLEQFHIPLRFRERAAGGTARPMAHSRKPIDIWDALFRSPRLAIVGEVGAGKSSTLKYVAIVLAQHKMPDSYIRRLTFLHHGRAFDHLIPIYADAGELDSHTDDLAVFLAGVLANYGFPHARGFVRARLKEGAFLLLLDHFGSLDRPERRAHLRELLARYPNVQLIVAIRTMHLASTCPDFVCFEPLPFADNEIETFIARKLGKDSPAAAALLQALERSSGLRSMAGNPLLLSALAWASESAPTPRLRLPDLYERCLEVLLDRATDVVSVPAPATMDGVTTNRALQEIGRYFHERHQEQFNEEELQTAVGEVLQGLDGLHQEHALLALIKDVKLLRRQNGDRYAFLRLALQQYLTARAMVATGRSTEILSSYVDDPWWHDVIVATSALLGDATDVVRQILAASSNRDQALILAARCAAEAPVPAHGVDESLQDQLFDIFQTGDRRNWHTAAVCIAALKSRRVRDYFPSLLRDGPVSECQRATWVMGRIGKPEWATVPLLGALRRTRPWLVRRRAAWALGQLRDRRAIPALVETLSDEKEEVAREAALALSVIGEPAVPWLLSSLASEQAAVRRMAVEALGKMGALAVRPLLYIIHDERQADDAVKGAAEALGLLGDAQAVPHLIRLLRAREGRFAECAARALAAVGEPAVRWLIESLPSERAELELRKTISNALVAIGEPSIEPLIKSLDSHSASVRGAAEEALAGIGAAATQALVVALRTENWNLRRRIAQILGRIGDERLAEPLVLALNDEDPGVRARVAQVLGQLGQEQAVEPLIDAMQNDPDEFVRRTAVRSLAGLRSERAIGPLIQVLENPELRDLGVAALSEVGESAIEPLIVAVGEVRNREAQQACIRALSIVGARSRIEEPTLSAVAKVYALLFAEKLSLDEMVGLLKHIRWWKHGGELYRAFASARTLAQARSLQDVARCPEQLLWVRGLEGAFRPTLKEILWDLNSVAQNIRLFLNDPRREGQRDAIISAIDTMTGIQEKLDAQLLEFEKRPFVDIIEAWQQLTQEAIKGLRGRAQLEIRLLTVDLALNGTDSAATIVFSLINVGDSAARNLSVTLGEGDGVFVVMGAGTQRLEPLGSGMQRNVEFLIKPLGVTEAAVVFEASYDDDEGTDRRYRFSGRVRFLAVEERYRPIPSSPYVPGQPVKTPQMFYGRKEVFAWIHQNISGAYQQNILVLHGERRMGKTSILYQLLNRPPTPQHLCVFFSLEFPPPITLGDLFSGMALRIRNQMIKFDLNLPAPVAEDFRDDAQRSFLNFCESLESKLGDRRLLVMVDEIDILIDKVEKGVLSEDVFHFIRGLMQHSEKITFIFTGAYKLREMLKDDKSILFNMVMPYRISHLNHNEAEALIVKPLGEYLAYDGLVVDKILGATACHPYYIQYICDSLVKLAQRKQKNFVSLPDLDVVLREVIEDNTGNLQRAVYAPLSAPEQRVLAALANVTDDYRILVPPDVVAHELDEYKLWIAKSDLFDALHSLCERDLLVDQRVGRTLQYGFRMNLIRMWLRQNEVVLRLSQEMKI
jgi:HEAT repeat protein